MMRGWCNADGGADLSIRFDGWLNMCNVKNKNIRTYSPSMARCCPPLAAAHPRVSSLSLSLSLSLYPPFRKSPESHSLFIFPHFPNLSRSPSLALSLNLDVVSVYQDRLEVAAAIFRWQHPPSLSLFLPPPLSPSIPVFSLPATVPALPC